MRFKEFSFLSNCVEALTAQGFVFHPTANGVRIGVDVNHPNWNSLGLVKGNQLSTEMESIEEAIAWCEGFKAASVYFSVALNQQPEAKNA